MKGSAPGGSYQAAPDKRRTARGDRVYACLHASSCDVDVQDRRRAGWNRSNGGSPDCRAKLAIPDSTSVGSYLVQISALEHAEHADMLAAVKRGCHLPFQYNRGRPSL